MKSKTKVFEKRKSKLDQRFINEEDLPDEDRRLHYNPTRVGASNEFRSTIGNINAKSEYPFMNAKVFKLPSIQKEVISKPAYFQPRNFSRTPNMLSHDKSI